MQFRTFSILLVLCLCCATVGEMAAQKKPKKLDPTKPEEALKIMRKLTASLKDGEECTFWWEGNVFSRVPGEKDRLLFYYQGMNVRATKGFQDSAKGYGYRHVSREVLFYMDPKTKQVVRKWTNPWTNKEVDVVHVSNDPVNSPPMYANANTAERAFKLPGRFFNGTYFLTSEVPLFYTNPLGGEYQEYVGGTYQAMEIFNFTVSEDELLNAEKDRADNVTVAWSRISKWLPWMEMGDRMGYLIFSGNGKKIPSWNDMPEEIKAEIKANYAAYEHAPPLDDSRPNETSWTHFKKVIDQKKPGKK